MPKHATRSTARLSGAADANKNRCTRQRAAGKATSAPIATAANEASADAFSA